MTHCNIACHGEPCKSQHWKRLSRICCTQYADAEEYAHALDYTRVEEYAGHGGVTSAKEEGREGGGIAQTTSGLTHLSCGGHQCSRRLAWFYQLSYHKVWFSTWVQVCMYYRYTVEVFVSRMKRSLDMSGIPSLPLSFTQYNLWEPLGQKMIKQDDCNTQRGMLSPTLFVWLSGQVSKVRIWSLTGTLLCEEKREILAKCCPQILWNSRFVLSERSSH